MTEQECFEQVVIYHYRKTMSDCAECGPLPLGSSFAAHQWDQFVKLREAQ